MKLLVEKGAGMETKDVDKLMRCHMLLRTRTRWWCGEEAAEKKRCTICWAGFSIPIMWKKSCGSTTTQAKAGAPQCHRGKCHLLRSRFVGREVSAILQCNRSY